MKIIDMGKLFGRPFEINEKNKARLILLTKFKKNSNGEKIIVIKNTKNPFKISDKNVKNIFTEYWTLREEIVNQKNATGASQYFEPSKTLIKAIGSLAHNISEINTTDPRFISLWNYNENIDIHIYFKEKEVFYGNFEDFKRICPDVDIKSVDFYEKFLFPFPSKQTNTIKGFGEKSFKKYLSDINSGYNSIVKKESKERVVNTYNLVRGIS